MYPRNPSTRNSSKGMKIEFFPAFARVNSSIRRKNPSTNAGSMFGWNGNRRAQIIPTMKLISSGGRVLLIGIGRLPITVRWCYLLNYIGSIGVTYENVWPNRLPADYSLTRTMFAPRADSFFSSLS